MGPAPAQWSPGHFACAQLGPSSPFTQCPSPPPSSFPPIPRPQCNVHSPSSRPFCLSHSCAATGDYCRAIPLSSSGTVWRRRHHDELWRWRTLMLLLRHFMCTTKQNKKKCSPLTDSSLPSLISSPFIAFLPFLLHPILSSFGLGYVAVLGCVPFLFLSKFPINLFRVSVEKLSKGELGLCNLQVNYSHYIFSHWFWPQSMEPSKRAPLLFTHSQSPGMTNQQDHLLPMLLLRFIRSFNPSALPLIHPGFIAAVV